jgi:NADPH:quinone reductase-like Zn-dependent oxidoreductase
MKAAVIKQAGGVPAYEDFPDPPTDGEREVVTLVAAGLHPIVRGLASGQHYGSAGGWPLIPGVDAVARTVAGRLVYAGFTEHPYGTFAQRMSVPMTLPLPDGADPIQVAGGLNPGMSSWMPLRSRAADGPLDTVLVLGATGVAGTLAVQNALILGADQVVAVGRNRQALARLESATTTTFALTGDDHADLAGLRAVLADHRPGTVLDFCWGRPAELSFDALARVGLDEDRHSCVYVEIGAAAGPRAMLPAALLRSTAITIHGSGAGSAKISDIMAELPVYLGKIADGTVRVPVSPYPLDDVTNAWTAERPGRRVVLTA